MCCAPDGQRDRSLRCCGSERLVGLRPCLINSVRHCDRYRDQFINDQHETFHHQNKTSICACLGLDWIGLDWIFVGFYGCFAERAGLKALRTLGLGLSVLSREGVGMATLHHKLTC